jgi:hypothetical protein
MLKPPQVELLLGPAALDPTDEKLLARGHYNQELVTNAERKRARLSYEALVEAEEAAAAVEAEEQDEEQQTEEGEEEDEEEEEMEDAAAAGSSDDAAAAAAAGDDAAAAAAADTAPPAAAAAANQPAAELQYCAYGRVAVLYASWRSSTEAAKYNWKMARVLNAGQEAAVGKQSGMQHAPVGRL